MSLAPIEKIAHFLFDLSKTKFSLRMGIISIIGSGKRSLGLQDYLMLLQVVLTGWGVGSIGWTSFAFAAIEGIVVCLFEEA